MCLHRARHELMRLPKRPVNRLLLGRPAHALTRRLIEPRREGLRAHPEIVLATPCGI